ncbi:hypothetical protein QFZ91_005132 [Paraburkholderia sp. JPY419]
MGPKTPVTEGDFFRQPLREQINLKHPLIRLADLINWERLGASMSESFVSRKGRPATSPRLIAGLLYLQHAFDLSDEEVVWQWVENPYWQVFTGETYLQTEPPIDPSSLTRWRKRMGEAGVEELLAETIEAAKRAGVIKASSVKRVIVDTTVMEKAIAHPTDSRLLERCREHLVKAAARHGLKLRQNYNREAPHLALQIGRYAHAKQYKRMRKALRTLRSRVGRVMRDVERQVNQVADLGCVFRTNVTGRFGMVTGDFGNVTGHFGNVTVRTGRHGRIELHVRMRDASRNDGGLAERHRTCADLLWWRAAADRAG